MAKHRVVIDTDPGIDDAMAILYACLDPDIELVGLTAIFGNVTTDIATRNALALVEMAGLAVPVAKGAEFPLIQPRRESAWEVHGREGFGNVPAKAPTKGAVDMAAAEFICQAVNDHPGEIVLCPVGPLTNIALALEHDPSIVEKVKSVTVMGGSLEAGGNVTPHAEANIWQDPHAAEAVFSADWPVTMIGLDVTHAVQCSPEDFTELAEKAPKLGGFLNEAAQFYFDFHEKTDGFRGCYMHDPSAVISIVRPDLFSIDEMPLEIIVEGEAVGKTVRSANTVLPSVNVAVDVKSDDVRTVFLKMIASGY